MVRYAQNCDGEFSSESYSKVKENRLKKRLFCRFKNAIFLAVVTALSLVTACDGKTPARSSSSDLIGQGVKVSDIVGRVVKVSDGDTITILDSSKTQHKIRLHGIDTPEKKQAFGKSRHRIW